ncbi:uncharacterized protein G2W53_039338 [Senna tora]|uniref:Uncharacterized protein n=1 Tax=Senna tora TaxID=362788 RepID=A0A834SNH8_9FABA|nr:uncharacterized protein G2W53_039338 [Senna tora]
MVPNLDAPGSPRQLHPPPTATETRKWKRESRRREIENWTRCTQGRQNIA